MYALGQVFPYLNYTDEESKTISTLTTDIRSYVNQYFAQVVTGDLTLEDSWEDYLNTLNQMGLEQMFSIYQASYERAAG